MSDFRYYRPNEFPPVVKNLIIINVIVFAAEFLLRSQIDLSGRLSLWSVNLPELFKPYQIVTYMFTHGSIGHIFFNMFGLYMFGRVLESVWGPQRFLSFYLICGVFAAVAHLAVQYFTGGYGAMLGASGAVMGVLVAFGYLFPNTEMFILFFPAPIKAKWVVIGYIALDLFGGVANFEGDNVAHFAHLGGALMGFILVLFWNKSNRRNFY